MNPITHGLTGWCFAEVFPQLGRREKALVTTAAIAPDLDGFGLIAELVTREGDRPLLWWTEYHHLLCHNLLFAIVFAAFAAALARTRSALTGLLAFVGVHLHLAGDLVGSRGPDDYQWPIPYLSPSRGEPQLAWSGQWHLNAWPNFAITIALLFVVITLAWRRGESVLGLVSQRADDIFVAALRARFGAPRATRPASSAVP
jgi:hypothetical protein